MTGVNGANAAASHYLDDERFNKSFTLPSEASRSAGFRVTFADFGHHTSEHVLLFCGPLMGSRYLLTTKDKLAQQHGVRVLCPDRPGFGGTTDVRPPDRVRVWLDIVEALLNHLNIQHVSVMGYSAGSIYATSVLFHLRHFLHPTRPYFALLTPWVHPSHSGVSTLKVVGALPNGLVGSYDKLVQLAGNLGSVFDFGNILSGLVPSLSHSAAPLDSAADPDAVALEESLSSELFRRITSEGVRGISHDLLLLLKRDEYPGSWGTWNDFDTLVPLLSRAEKARHTVDSTRVSPLRVHVFFAESDSIIGTTIAPDWFNHCWRPEQCGDSIKYASDTIPNTIHDNILDLRYGIMSRIFQEMVE
ncbi:hypothetical protein F5Y08DRAFT_126178 [Xylaria arbuscula]|nr:hypothetical protein F5Y08DRAFT_126178 [Xylaria arbuscula]